MLPQKPGNRIRPDTPGRENREDKRLRPRGPGNRQGKTSTNDRWAVMSIQPTRRPEGSRQGEAREREEKDTKRPTLPAGIRANRNELVRQSRLTRTPTQHESGTGISTKFKQFRISHLNCRNSRAALDKLTKLRRTNSILIVSEPPTSDGQPPEIPGYVKLNNDEGARICAYIRD